ncbi:MAG: FtsX-like permease family protein [Candidatus Latescibacterota bacterium]
MGWSLRMAWRDSRGQRRRLLLYTGAIALGIAALTGLRGLSRSMEHHVAVQAAVLLGADLSLESRAPFPAEVEAVLDSLPARRARQVELHSMVHAPRTGGARLAQVRALEGGYPFYGRLRTEPPAAADTYQEDGAALVDDGLLLQLDAEVGDTLRLGHLSLPVAGRLLHLPGQSELRSDVLPPILVPLRLLAASGLVQRGSRVEYGVFLRLDGSRDPEARAQQLQGRLERYNVDVDTPADRQRRVGRTLNNLYRFLGVGSFVALLLGAVGVASAVHAHVRGRLETVAVLRSLGASARQATAIYLLQAAGMGLAGALAGAVGGTPHHLSRPQAATGSRRCCRLGS